MGPAFWQFVIVSLIWLPVLLVAFSSRTSGAKKAAWATANLFLPWLAYFAFLAYNPKPETKITQ